MKKMVVLTGETHEVGCSTRQELCERKISWWFGGEKDLKDDLEWPEKKSELNWTSMVKSDNLSECRYAGRLETYTEFFDLY